MAKIKKLLEKGSVTIQGHEYNIKTTREYVCVCLVPVSGHGDVASSGTFRDADNYIHGNEVYRKAVEVAWKMADYLNKQKKKGSDY